MPEITPSVDQHPPLAALLPPGDSDRLCASLSVLLDSPVALQDPAGTVTGGSRGLAAEARVVPREHAIARHDLDFDGQEEIVWTSPRSRLFAMISALIEVRSTASTT